MGTSTSRSVRATSAASPPAHLAPSDITLARSLMPRRRLWFSSCSFGSVDMSGAGIWPRHGAAALAELADVIAPLEAILDEGQKAAIVLVVVVEIVAHVTM